MVEPKRLIEIFDEAFVLFAMHTLKTGTKKQIIKKAEKLSKKYRDLKIDELLNVMAEKGMPDDFIQAWVNSTELASAIEYKQNVLQ